MRTCPKCEQANPDEAHFCHQCGTPFEQGKPEATPAEVDEDHLWRMFIGPSKTVLFSLSGWTWDRADRYYMGQFRKFGTGQTPRFALTWHWPAFLVPPFLWFLYRKMYLYAAVYLVGPAIAFVLTQDPTVTFVWQLIAGATANYLYFWHIKDHLRHIREHAGPHRAFPEGILRDTGGVQPYVFVLGIMLHLLVLVAILQGPPPEDGIEEQGPSQEIDPQVF
ncbi:MAG: zinc-ribbon domain-containing protein [Nitrospirales bacterium]